MKKIIKRKLHISTYSRDFIDYINHEFYSHDKHNAFFEFTMEQLPTDNVVALFYFQKTKRYAELKGVVEDNKVTIEFDTSLITANETVCGYIYFEKVEQSADVCRFCFNVKVSEIDKLKNAPVVEKETRRLIPMSEIVTKAELQELFKTIEKNGGTYNDTEIRNSISSIEERVQTLEAKPDNNTVYDDRDVINRLNVLENNASRYITEHQPLTSIEEHIRQIELRFNNLSNIYLTSHQSLEHLATNAALNKIEQRVQQLEQTRGSQPTVDSNNLETNAKVEAIEERVQALENKPTVDTSEFAKKTDIPQAYNDSELSRRVSDLETKEDKDTVYNDEEIKRRLSNLEERPQVDVSEFAKKSEVPTVDSLNNLLRTQGEQATKISTLEAKAGYEIHGTGMPNGQVEALIGTTYVDTAVTNGALKWIKQSSSGNTGWKVLIGDTGWRTLNSVSRLGNSFIKIRRVNNLVTYNFGGLQWGWFGIIRRNGPGFARHNSTGERGAKVLAPNSIPEGFRSENSLIGGIYNDAGKPYGIWYLGGKSDSNYIQFSFNDPIPTDRDIGDIRVSAISYVTDEDWPTRLP